MALKLYEVSLFDTEDGGHLIGNALFETAKEARNEFLRIREKIYSPHNSCDTFKTYMDNNFNLFIKVVKPNGRIRIDWLGEPVTENKVDYNKDRKAIRNYFNGIEHYFHKAVEDSFSWPQPKQVYDEISRHLSVLSVNHTITKNVQTADYEIHIFGCNKPVYVHVDFKKMRYVISGKEWHGYIMPQKRRNWRTGKMSPAVWYKHER